MCLAWSRTRAVRTPAFNGKILCTAKARRTGCARTCGLGARASESACSVPTAELPVSLRDSSAFNVNQYPCSQRAPEIKSVRSWTCAAEDGRARDVQQRACSYNCEGNIRRSTFIGYRLTVHGGSRNACVTLLREGRHGCRWRLCSLRVRGICCIQAAKAAETALMQCVRNTDCVVCDARVR
jgi:hypothetical protein